MQTYENTQQCVNRLSIRYPLLRHKTHMYVRVVSVIFCLLAWPLSAEVKLTRTTSGHVNLPASVVTPDDGNISGEVLYRVNADLGVSVGSGSLILFGSEFISRDTSRNGFASKQRAALGAELRFPAGRGARVSFGGKYEIDNRDIASVTYKTLIATADYSLYRRADGPNLIRVVNGWANLRYPGGPDASNDGNLLAQGRFEWSWEPKAQEVKIIPFLALGFTDDSAGLAYNNKVHAEAGLRIKTKVSKSVDVSLSLRYITERRFQTHDTYSGPRISLGWFGIF